MILNKMLAMGILVPILILTAPNVYARNLSDTQRYNDGYSNGAQAAATDSTYNPTCDPTGVYTSGGGHTPTYCNGWANGYATTWNANHVVRQVAPTSPVPVTNTNNQSVGQSFVGTDFGDFSNLANVPIIGGLIASKSITTGVLHNEQGVFIPWKVICDKGQAYILQSCGTLLDSNGNLTPQGDTAVGCIRNGLAVAAIAQKNNMLGLAQTVLNFAAGPTGCGGIVNLDTIKNAPDFENILNYLATLIP